MKFKYLFAIAVAICCFYFSAKRADTQPDCNIMPVGLILQRWNALDGHWGPLGCPNTPETPVEGSNGRKMVFQNGEIVWSPSQGTNMMVAGYQQEDNIIINWGDTSPFNYEKFIVRWDRNGQNMGQADVDSYIEPTNGFFRIQNPLPGIYSISVEGCNEDITGSDCPQKWTIPISVRYDVPPPPVYANCAHNLDLQPRGLIGDRWAKLGGGEGPLGCQTGRVLGVYDRAGLRQRFEHGEIAWSPEQGETLTVAAYQKGGELVADWGDTRPFSYEKFILRLDKDGKNIAQHDIGEGRGGHWSTPVSTPGIYSIVIEGCNEDITGSDCPQKWTIPVTVKVAFPPEASPPPIDTNCPISAVGLIRERWIELGARGGLLGCPVAAEQPIPGRRGRSQSFENGEIIWSPEQGQGMVLAVYQQGEQVIANWGSTAPFEYDTFILRVDYEGNNIGQIEVARQRTSGSYAIGVMRKEDDTETPILGNGTGRYSVVVEGCKEGGGLAGVDCPQRWTAAAAVNYRATAPGPDFSSIPTPRTVESALQDKVKRALIAANDVAMTAGNRDDKGPLDGDWGDSETTHAIAMLYIVADKIANGGASNEPRRFGQRFGMIGEINNAVRLQKIYAKSGTNVHAGPNCTRTGDYDMALKGYIPILYRYGHLLAPDVRYRILHLLNKIGPHDHEDDWFTCGVVTIPETENHTWMIESSRYLTNQLYAHRTADPKFNNDKNGMDGYILQLLDEPLKRDFVEYNSRPYARLTWAAIQNLYDYAGNPQVKNAARSVLDYLSAKAALSGNDGRRSPPYRRRVSHNKVNYFHPEADRVKKRFLVYTAPTLAMRELTPPNRLEGFAVSEMVLAAATTYQPPAAVLDLMVNPSHRSYYQRFTYYSSEAYAAEADFLIAGGGLVASYAYTVAGLGKDEDLGVAHSTVLMPTGQFTTPKQMIRFDSPGICVAPGFACGGNPVIPKLYTSNPACFSRKGKWTFIDFASDACKDAEHREFGFFAAVFGAGENFGFLEAVPKGKLNGMTLAAFADRVIARNGQTQFVSGLTNRYVAYGGNEIRFNASDYKNPIVSTGIAAIDRLFVGKPPGLAQGTVVQSIGYTGKMTITNEFTGEKIEVGYPLTN
ncbi:MAG: hypothetical protein MOB07_22175 [Acidobacteria bacterium]|nr:hypothetical protein [Acidobacteriota bacterium]